MFSRFRCRAGACGGIVPSTVPSKPRRGKRRRRRPARPVDPRREILISQCVRFAQVLVEQERPRVARDDELLAWEQRHRSAAPAGRFAGPMPESLHHMSKLVVPAVQATMPSKAVERSMLAAALPMSPLSLRVWPDGQVRGNERERAQVVAAFMANAVDVGVPRNACHGRTWIETINNAWRLYMATLLSKLGRAKVLPWTDDAMAEAQRRIDAWLVERYPELQLAHRREVTAADIRSWRRDMRRRGFRFGDEGGSAPNGRAGPPVIAGTKPPLP